jgi:adenosylcobinamide kinase/adenosylcobinamide-phosphate guanylyltransferase
MTPNSVTLVLGGAASGKSRFAQQLAETTGSPLLYVATAQAGDSEMRERILRHQQERGVHWQTLEESHDLAGRVPVAAQGKSAVLVDCVTLWLSNLLLADERHSVKAVWPAVEAMIVAFDRIQAPLILVSNELGLGLVPEYPLGRVFRDLSGQVNQRLAARADHVWLVTAGLPMALKTPRLT